MRLCQHSCAEPKSSSNGSKSKPERRLSVRFCVVCGGTVRAGQSSGVHRHRSPNACRLHPPNHVRIRSQSKASSNKHRAQCAVCAAFSFQPCSVRDPTDLLVFFFVSVSRSTKMWRCSWRPCLIALPCPHYAPADPVGRVWVREKMLEHCKADSPPKVGPPNWTSEGLWVAWGEGLTRMRGGSSPDRRTSPPILSQWGKEGLQSSKQTR